MSETHTQPEETRATQTLREGPARPLSTPAVAAGESTVSTPQEALHLDELRRTRRVVAVMAILELWTAAAVALLGGDTILMTVAIASLTAGAFISGALWYMVHHPDHYTRPRVSAVWLASAVVVAAATYYFGVFSPAPMVLVLGVYFINLGESQRLGFAVYAISAVFQLAMGMLIVAGAVEDRALIAPDIEPLTRAVTIAMVQLVLLISMFLARWSRAATLSAMTELHDALRSVRNREALLEEARRDLDRALKIGGPGRMTDQTVGSFRLGVVLGRGGMGEVYEAVRVDSGEPAAVKLLRDSVRDDPRQLARFLREVDVAASLDSPHVVRVLEHGDETADQPYLAMERLRGEDLAQHLRERRFLPGSEVSELLRQLAHGVDAAAKAGIVHRDLNPRNVFRAEAGRVPLWKILDFGVAKLAQSHNTLTQGNIVGTPGYMAPEQAQSGDVDHRTDIHALGAIAYRAVTGHPPFRGKDLAATLFAVVYSMPEQPSLLAELPRDIDLVLAIALAKAPDRRFDNAHQLANAFDSALRGELSEQLRATGRAAETRWPWGAKLSQE